jgi:hypothetical protein
MIRILKDPSDDGRDLIAQWLSDHSELAVINDGIDKSCNGEGAQDGFPPDAARLQRSHDPGTARRLQAARQLA